MTVTVYNILSLFTPLASCDCPIVMDYAGELVWLHMMVEYTIMQCMSEEMSDP